MPQLRKIKGVHYYIIFFFIQNKKYFDTNYGVES